MFQTLNECKDAFDREIASICTQSQHQQQASESAVNVSIFNHLVDLFKLCLFGFECNSTRWKVPRRFTSKSPSHSADHQWFLISVRRLHSIFLRIAQSADKSSHFISDLVNDEMVHFQMTRFQCLGLVLVEHLRFTLSHCIILAFFILTK